MAKKHLLILAVIVFILSFLMMEGKPFDIYDTVETFTNRNLSMGSRGNDVSDLQTRLQELGYYSANVDGVFGYQTLYAVRKFQKDNGLKIDGIVGENTRKLLQEKTKGQGSSGNQTTQNKETAFNGGKFSQNDFNLMANAVYGEARGEPYVGQVAVAAVILNRIKHPVFPNTASGVIFEPRAFTAVADGQIWMEPNDSAKKAVQDAINGWDPSGGAIYYFNPDTATSSWIWTRPQRKQIGKHIFCD